MAFPWIPVAAAGLMGIGEALFGGNKRAKENRDARRRDNAIHEQNIRNWRYNNRMGKRDQKFQQEEVEIARRNQTRNINLQQLQLEQNRNYGMQIRQLEYDNDLRLQQEQRRIAVEQKGFNEIAYRNAVEEQGWYNYEQMIGFDLEKLAIEQKGDQASSKYLLDQNMLDQQQRSRRSKNSFQMQAAQIESLESAGAAKAKGQSGRTAGKNIQAAIAKNGLKQAQIAESTMQAGEQYALSTQQNVQDLSNMSQELIAQRQSLKFAEQSLGRSNRLALKNLKQQLEQANAEAFSNIMLDPILAPELPEIPNLMDYAAEFQDIPEWIDLPEPVKIKGSRQQGNFVTDFLGSAGGQSAINMGIGALANASVPGVPGGDTLGEGAGGNSGGLGNGVLNSGLNKTEWWATN